MIGLENQRIIQIWETGQYQHPIDRAITMILHAEPERTWDDIVLASIGERNSRLLTIRELTFGTVLNGLAKCSFCEKDLEFLADVAEVRSAFGQGRTVYIFAQGDYEIQFRLANSRDMSVMVSSSFGHPDARVLLQQCIMKSSFQGAETPFASLPDEVLDGVSAEMARLDPQAVMAIHVDCAECGHALTIPIDIAHFLWREIEAQAKRLLREVHALARCYGWREKDILNLSAARRFFYMELAQA